MQDTLNTGAETMPTPGDQGSSVGPVRKPSLTKIIATVGPASSSPEMIDKLITAGVSIFRLNFSHGTFDEHGTVVKRIRNVADSRRWPIAILGDLRGPRIRIGDLPTECTDVPTGASVVFRRGRHEPLPSPHSIELTCSYERLIDDVGVGHRILIADGAIRMLVTEKQHDSIQCAVIAGGIVKPGKGVNLPDSDLSLSALSEFDKQCAEWAIESDLDFLALSFVSEEADVAELRNVISQCKTQSGVPNLRMPIVAKIERPAAVDNIESIIEAADGIMVARGDLGVEMDLAIVPVIQKRLLEIAHSFGKPCIVATQMLESMIDSASPTRAEVSDVANAIYDGADAVMLSGETAIGQYPIVVVEMMRRVCEQTELHRATMPVDERAPTRLVASRNRSAALAHGVWTVARDLAVKFVVVWSQQGGGARYLSRNTFHIPVVAASTDDRALRQMQLLRGVTPIRMPLPDNLAHFTAMTDAYLSEAEWAHVGDMAILVAGGPIGRVGTTNSMAIHVIGNSETGYLKH